MIKVFLDTNIVMDMLAKREPFYLNAANIFALSVSKKAQLFVSPMTFATVSYLLGKQDKHLVNPLLSKLREISGVTRADQNIVDESLHSDFSDFEDALQYYSSLTEMVDCIVTRNTKDFSNSQIPVLSPEQFLNTYVTGS